MNQPGLPFTDCGRSIRAPLISVKGMTERTRDRIILEREHGEFSSVADFYRRVMPAPEEMEAMIRVGAFDEFAKTRTAQSWGAQFLRRFYGSTAESDQGWLWAAARRRAAAGMPLREPTRRERLQWEIELFGFAVSGHPLELFDNGDPLFSARKVVPAYVARSPGSEKPEGRSLQLDFIEFAVEF